MGTPETPRFRNPGRSAPAYEQDGIENLVAYSTALRRRGEVSIWRPDRCSQAKLPVLILLHGVYGTHWSWFQQGGAHKTAEKMIGAGEVEPILLACPSDGLWGEGSGYLPLPESNAEEWILEVPALLASQGFPVDLSSVGICGLSMGGFGALRLAAKHPRRFRMSSAHSPVTDLKSLERFLPIDQIDRIKQLGEPEASILHWAEINRERLAPMRFDCGTSDDLYRFSQELHRGLDDKRVPHHFQSCGGAHDWTYWASAVEESIRFFAMTLAGLNRFI